MTPREERGQVIAGAFKLACDEDGWWEVPSQSGKGKYLVCLTRKKPFCSCPDHEETERDCKHIYACRYIMERVQDEHGNVTVTETLTVTKRKVCPRDYA